MNNKFTDREKSFEKKFQMDAELQFKIAARSNKYLGEWVSTKLGKNVNVSYKKFRIKGNDEKFNS